jgi:hypothetical protein
MNPADVLPAPVLQPPTNPDNKWERERQAFYSLLPSLLETDRGTYVAIHDGRVVVRGADFLDVAQRAYEQQGYIPMYIDLVAEHPLPPVRVPTPRLLSNLHKT